MPKFVIQNFTDKAVKLAVEPWADVVELAPDGEALVSVMSDRLKYSANGREENWEDKTHFLSSHVTLRKK